MNRFLYYTTIIPALTFSALLPASGISLDELQTLIVRTPLPTSSTIRDVTFHQGIGVAVGENGTVLRSTDNGASWALVANLKIDEFVPSLSGVRHNGQRWTVVSTSNRSWTSTNLVDWELWNPPGFPSARGLAAGNGLFVTTDFSSGNSAVSSDGETWEIGSIGVVGDRGRDVAFFNNLFLMATNFGIFSSPDGLTWTRHVTLLPDDPQFFESIENAGDLAIAVGRRGLIYTSADGVTWVRRENPLTTNLISVTREAMSGNYLFSDSNSLWESADLITFTQQRLSGTPILLRLANAPDGRAVAVGTAGALWKNTSPWTRRSESLAESFDSLAFGSGLFVTVSRQSRKIFASSLGRTWREVASPGSAIRTDVVYGNGTFATLLSDGSFLSSADGNDWEEEATNLTFSPNQLHFLNGQWVAVGQEGKVVRSSDGLSWAESQVTPAIGTASGLLDVAFGDGLFVVVGLGTEGPILATSPDLETWTNRTVPGTSETRRFTGVEFGNGRFMVFALSGSPALSEDGITWAQLEGERFLRSIQTGYDDELGFYAPATSLLIKAFPKDGTLTDRFTSLPGTLNGTSFNALAEGNGVLVGVGSGARGQGMILSSPFRTPDYLDWVEEKFGPGKTDALVGLMRDPDFDGQSNLEEYALDTDPRKVSPPPAIRGELSGDSVTFSFDQRTGLPDLRTFFETSSDLQQWNASENVDRNPGPAGQTTYSTTLPVDSETIPRQFVRPAWDLILGASPL